VISPPHWVITQPMSLHVPEVNALIAQLITPLRNERESGHVSATQSIRHVKSKPGAPPPNEKQPKTHARLSPQARSEHIPQSAGQLMQSSKPPADSQRMLPHTEQVPQSTAQLAQVSVPRHRPSPQPMHRPQSSGQVKQSSAAMGSQLPSPQRGQAPQSGAQVTQSSPASGRQKPSPHTEQAPQSLGQLLQLSVGEQVPSPQRTHRPQSTGQVLQSSAPPQVPSPQVSQSPQSSGQVSQRSVG
jgi:hypothetical protein